MQKLLTNKTVEKLKYDLVREGLVSFENLSKAEETAKNENINLGQSLLKSKLISEKDLLEFLEAKLHIPYVNLDDYSLDEKCLNYISKEDALKYHIIPLFEIEKVLTIAMADPMDLFVLNSIMESINCDIEPILCSERSIIESINKNYSESYSGAKKVSKPAEKAIDWRDELNNIEQNENQVKRLINAILEQAVFESVHELFFEHSAIGLNLKFKALDGVVEKGSIPLLLIPAFISQLKALSNLDPSVSEIPQIGKLVFDLDGVDHMASISAFPTISGERIALKIYKPPQLLESLLIGNDELQILKKACQNSGLILVCGSELSGKTSVVYSILSSLTGAKNNIMTLESLVKYDIEKINQCELRESVGFNFEKAAKQVEFQSPDVIYFESYNIYSNSEYLESLVAQNRLVITEFTVDSLNRLENNQNLSAVKNLISCVVFIENKDKISVISSLEC